MNPKTVTPPPHAPRVGRLGRRLGALHFTGAIWYRAHHWLMKKLPDGLISPLLSLVSGFFFFALGDIRRSLASNLEAVAGPEGWWQRQVKVYRCMRNAAWCMSERYERAGENPRGSLTVEGDEVWQQAHRQPEGFILVTAHVGHWEVGSMLVPERHVHVVREEEMDPRAQEMIQNLYANQDNVPLTMHFARDGDPGLGPRLIHALRDGEIVALQGDRPRASGRQATVQLFGRDLQLPAGPAALARAANVALIPVFVFRTGRRASRIVFRPPIRVTEPGRQGLTVAMRQIAGEVEWAIRQEPEQWFCFRELWPSA